jgi:hypothetical protein
MITPKVVIIMARCSRSKKSFGIRMEDKLAGQWSADWAFAMKEDAAKREGYDKSDISGNFSIDDTYPGCPYCEQLSFVKCGKCEKVSCGGEQGSTHVCPWCNNNAQISGYIESLSAGNDL